jgi:hypothetical protein
MGIAENGKDQDLRHSTFVAVGVVFLVFLYLFSPFTQVFLGWFVDFEDNISHKVHEVTFGALFAIIFVGVLVQLRAASRNFAGLLQAAIAAVILSIVITITTGWEWTTLLYLVPLGAMVWLHPNRVDVIRYRLQPHTRMVALMALITYSFLDASVREFTKAANEVREHQSHWGGMAAFALTLLIIGFLAALRIHGWPIMALTTGLSVILYAAVSLSNRFDASARPGATGIFAILWGLAFLAVARRARPVPAVRRGEDPGTAVTQARPAPSKPDPRLVVAAVAAVVVNIFFGALGSPVAGPTLILAVVLIGAVARRWWQWRRADRSPGAAASLPTAEDEPGRPVARSRLVRRVTVVAGLGALVMVGGFGAQIAREITEPPVPHSIESTARTYCVSCHAMGEEDAPRINMASHPYDDGDAPGRCADCHDTPRVTPALTSAAGLSTGTLWFATDIRSVESLTAVATLTRDEALLVASLIRNIDEAKAR